MVQAVIQAFCRFPFGKASAGTLLFTDPREVSLDQWPDLDQPLLQTFFSTQVPELTFFDIDLGDQFQCLVREGTL